MEELGKKHELETAVEYNSFKIKVGPKPPQGETKEQATKRIKEASTIVWVKSATSWKMYEANIMTVLGITTKALEEGALERTRA